MTICNVRFDHPFLIKLSTDERAEAMRVYLGSSDPTTRIRAHILLLLDDGRSKALVEQLTYSESSQATQTIELFREGAEDGLTRARFCCIGK